MIWNDATHFCRARKGKLRKGKMKISHSSFLAFHTLGCYGLNKHSRISIPISGHLVELKLLF